MKDYLNYINPILLKYEEDVKKVRGDLHRIPEIGFKEFKTQEYILNYLRDIGYEPSTVAGTGVYLFIPGKEDSTIAFRTDIDALPVLEPKENIPRSEHEGYMHACGHDGHMTMLLHLARILKEENITPKNSLLLIFQPAEEGPGGAEPIIETGIFDKYNVKGIFGFHLIPFIDEGIISTTEGPMFAMTSEFYPVIEGKSAHAGHPDEGIDTIVAASQFVLAVQSIVSRNIKPNESVLINIGTFNSGEAMNIVPKIAKLSGTLRSYNTEMQNLMKKRLTECLEGIDIMFGTKSSLNFVDMYSPVVNDTNLFNQLWSVVNGPKEIFDPVMLAEDFSMYQQKMPGVFIGLGTKTEDYNSDLHTAEFNFNEEVLLRGIDLYLKLAEDIDV